MHNIKYQKNTYLAFVYGGEVLENSIIVYKSITMANRAKKLVEKEKIKASVTQLPSNFKFKGCTYALSVERKNLENALEISEKYALNVRAYFTDGTPESGVYKEDKK